MNNVQEDKFGMFLKTELFLTTNATTLSGNTAFAAIKTGLTGKINAIIQADSTATRNITGYTESKNELRSELETKILTIAAAARGYYTTNPDDAKKKQVKLVKTDITEERDTELIVRADTVHDVANPVKTLLAPWNVTGADVDALLALVDDYRAELQKPRAEIIISETSGHTVDRLFAQTDELLDECDDHMAVYEYTNIELYEQYKLNRAIDNSGGNSGTEGYEINNYTVPAGGSVIIPVGVNPIAPDTQLYFRVVTLGGGVIICTTGVPVSPCVNGYTLPSGETFKDAASALDINLALPTLQITNPGLTDVIVRAGIKLNP